MIIIGMVAFLVVLVLMVALSIVGITIVSAIYVVLAKTGKKKLEDREINRIMTIGFWVGLILTILIFM